MNYLIIFIVIGITIMIYLYVDYLYTKSLSKKVKIGDKKRVYNSDETKYVIVTVVDIYQNKKGETIAICEHGDGKLEEIPVMSLVY